MNYFSKEIAQIKHEISKVWTRDSSSPLILFLEGPLGAGKTTFVQEWVESLGGSRDQVQSPTFLKLLEYKVPNFGKVVHIDTYRMQMPQDLENLGLEFLEDAKLWLIEWPKLFIEFLKTQDSILSLLGFRECFWVKIKLDPIHGSEGGEGRGTQVQALTRQVSWTQNQVKEIIRSGV